jgi:7-cyano-7-deazaguanine synthase in queuosine biosynthesis
MKFLLLNGGGIDSLAVARATRTQYPKAVIESVHFCYGQPAEAKLAKGAKAIADKYCNSHDEYHMCKSIDGEIGPVEDMTIPLIGGTFRGIPFWGLWLLINGFVIAQKRKCEYLLTGIWADAYRPEMIDYLEKALGASKITRKRVSLEAPLYGHDRELVYWIVEDDPVLSQTWSCNYDPPCGVCRKCEYREEKNIVYTGE